MCIYIYYIYAYIIVYNIYIYIKKGFGSVPLELFSFVGASHNLSGHRRPGIVRGCLRPGLPHLWTGPSWLRVSQNQNPVLQNFAPYDCCG